MRKLLLIVLLAALILPSQLMALEISSTFTGIRPLGMGGAFTAVADDENALFYNPAGLDRIEKVRFALVNPYIKFSDAGIDTAADFSDADMDNTAEVADVLRDHMGENINVQLALMPYFAKKRFALAVLAQSTANFEVAHGPSMNVDATISGSGHVGYGRSFLEKKLRVGAAMKYMSAATIDATFTHFDIASNNLDQKIEDAENEGSGVGFDLGAMYTFPVLMEPTIALAITDVADTDLGDAGEVPQSINLGASATYTFKKVDFTGAIDLMDITSNKGEDEDYFKRLHMGLEIKLPYILTLRTGVNQGYSTYGATVNFKLLKLEYANYAEELGSFAGQKADRRQVVQLSLGWF